MKNRLTIIGLLIILMMGVGPAFADNSKKTKDLLYEKNRLSAAYIQKQREMNELTLKIHDVDSELEKLRVRK